MPKYVANLKGNFMKKVTVIAENKEEAEKMFSDNLGEDLEETAIEKLEVSNFEQIED